MKNFLFAVVLTSIFCSFSSNLSAQNIAPAQKECIALTNGNIHVGNGEVFLDGVVIFDKGKLTYVGDENTNTGNCQVIDVEGKEIYPGFIDAGTNLGLEEVEAVRATLDSREVGGLNPSIRSIISYNTDSRVIPTIITNGILLSHIVPTSSSVGGQSSVVQMNAWNYEDATYSADMALNIFWPSKPIALNDKEKEKIEEKEKLYQGKVEEIKKLFADAKVYCAQNNSSKPNIVLESTCSFLNNSKKVIVYTNSAKEIMDAGLWAKSIGLKIIVSGGAESYKILDFIKEHNISVILGKTHDLPMRDDEDIDIAFKLPSILQNAGIPYCISMYGNAYWNHRNLPFQAGTAAAYGLTKEEALSSITLNVAKILGIEKMTGSLEVGKDANLIVSDGDVLDMKTSQLKHIFIQGRNVAVNNIQIEQYQRYMDKYGKEIRK